MTKVTLDMAMSLDGFIGGPNGEDRGLHDYFFSPSAATAKVIEEGFKTTGAIIMGRRAYDIGAAQDGFVDNPYIELESTRVIDSTGVTHLRFRVIK